MTAVKKIIPTVLFEESLRKQADWVREQTLLIHKRAPETRVASSLSAVEIFTALYYGSVVQFDAKNPHWDGRDRVVISKGHGSLSMYPILADLGFFPLEELEKVCTKGSFLGGIPDPIIPGYETVNGSLGHGVGVACGMAVGLKAQGKKQKVFVLTGDGELHEGSNWEGFLFAAHHELDNLNLIVDFNECCMLGPTERILSLGDLARKFQSFGFEVDSVDGHDVGETQKKLMAMSLVQNKKPKALIAKTVKGKGAPKLEGNPLCHVTGLSPSEIDEILKKDH